MTPGLFLYRLGTRLVSPFAPLVFRWRAAKGKEKAGRYHERVARRLPERENGRLVWLHGASLGECKLLLGLASELRKLHPDIFLLFTSQTLSAAGMISAGLPQRAIHQMLPLDTRSMSLERPSSLPEVRAV